MLGADLVVVVRWVIAQAATVVLADPPVLPTHSAFPLSRADAARGPSLQLLAPTAEWMRTTVLGPAQPWADVLLARASRAGTQLHALLAFWRGPGGAPAHVRTSPDALRRALDDLLERITAHEEEHHTAVRLSALLGTVPQGIVLTDEESGTALVNGVAASLLGIAPGLVRAAQLAAAMRDLRERCADPAALEREGRRLLATPEATREDWIWQLEHPEARTMRVATFPVRAPTHRGRLWLFDDDTARARARALEDQLRQSQKMEAIGKLAGGIAHDFNNLLTVMHGHTELLLGQLPVGSTTWQDATEVQRAVERASGLTRQLLAFSRKQVVQPRPVLVREVVQGVERLLSRVIGEHIQLRCELTDDEGRVLVDPGQLEQVLMNLAVNARDAMPDGGTLLVRTARLVPGPGTDGWGATAGPADPHLHLVVQDTGRGMDAETRAHAFEPFFTTKPVGEGTGLGLATVHGIVEQAGGHAWIESEPGLGTRVHIALPYVGAPDTPAVAPDASATSVAATDACAAPAPHRSRTVLVVEDEEMVRGMMVRMLEHAGHRTVTARNGVEALACWAARRQAGEPVDALVTDVVMPKLGGRELVRRLRQEGAQVPVLFVSGYTDGELTETDLAGRTAFLQKPFTSTALFAAVDGLLQSHEGTSGSASPKTEAS